jgi:hypothetical protein
MEKIQSWKEYCNLTTSSNPWNEVYKLAAGKRRHNTQLTTLRKPDGSFTEDLRDTLQLMMEHFTPDDKEKDDTELHKLARAKLQNPQTQMTINTSQLRKPIMQSQAWIRRKSRVKMEYLARCKKGPSRSSPDI